MNHAQDPRELSSEALHANGIMIGAQLMNLIDRAESVLMEDGTFMGSFRLNVQTKDELLGVREYFLKSGRISNSGRHLDVGNIELFDTETSYVWTVVIVSQEAKGKNEWYLDPEIRVSYVELKPAVS